MLRITPSTSAKGAKEYFTQSLSRDDTGYYHEGQELAGQWGGKGSQMLGLSGAVSQEAYFALCDNRNPSNGERMSPRNKDDRRVGFDFTFSAPKSVSVLYELSGDERILKAFRDSVSETMKDIEREMKTRVRKGGDDHDRETGNMVYAEFVHFTARPVGGVPDPHMHSHVYAFNLSHDDIENRWKAGQFGDLKRDATWFEAAFDARLSYKLNALGIATEKNPSYSFEVAGTPKSLVDKFSNRRNQINAKAEEKGISDAVGKHSIGYYDREHKNTGVGKSELRAEWDSRLTDEERSALADAIHGRPKGDRSYTPDEAKEYALAHSFQKASTVSEKRLKTEALKYGVGSVLPEDVADISQHPEVIAETRGGQLMTTTKTMLNHELAFLQFAKDGQRKQKPLVNRGGEKYTGSDPLLSGLSDEQRKAALHVLTSRDTVTGIVGKAGTGKTTMMRATRDVIESQGLHVFAFAPSSQASRGVLAKEGFKDAETLAMLLKNTKLQEKTKGQVLWVDEAGLVSSRDMRKLMDIAKKNDNRVILSGDYTQHSSVEAGDAFRVLEKEAGVKLARLTEVRRQTEPGYRKAVEQISKGTGRDAQKGFDALDRMNCVIEASGSQRHGMLVKDYLKAAEDGKSALIIAPTHSEGQKLTDELRGELKARGAIGKERKFVSWRSTGWTDAQKGDVRNYEPGMVIEFNQNAKGFARAEKGVVAQDNNGIFFQKTDGSRAPVPTEQAERFDVFRPSELKLGKGDRIRVTKNGEAKVQGQAKGTRVYNGDIFTVEGFTKEGDIRLEKGKLLPKDWTHMSLGYVDTSYSSQGKTVDRVFIAAGNESLPATNQQQWYVSASRGREQAKLYVDSKDDVRNAIARTGQRLSAVELTHTRLRSPWHHRFYKSLSQNRVSRFLSQRATAIARQWQDRGQEVVSHG
jgi:conjugative relaxase-like TrwC/TraI family protein